MRNLQRVTARSAGARNAPARCRRSRYVGGLTAALIVIMVAPPAAQAPAPAAAARPTGAIGGTAAEHVDLLVGRSTVLRTDRPIKRISLPRPEIADALVTAPTEVLVHGKAPGNISLLVWGDAGEIRTFEVSVRRDLGELEARVRHLFPGEPIEVTSNGADVVLSGVVSSKYVVEKATSLAAGYVEKAENVVNLLRQEETLRSNQILLRVRFAEVSRSALQELGASFFTSPTGVNNTLGRVTTQQFPAPGYDKLEYSKDSADFGAPVTGAKGEFTFSDFLNLFLFSERYDLGVMVRALSSKGLFQSLAEPNLVTQNGREASFLAGGEFPIPVVQGGGLNAAVTIMFKEFGVRLRFTPTVIGEDVIHLKVAPEVSALDFANAVSIQGFRVPALSTRRTETEVELRSGQTFAIAGLIDNSMTQTMSKVPGLGDIPILGYLFRSRAYQKNQTELVVMITPQILRRDSPGVTPHLPPLVEPYLPPERETIPNPPPAFIDPPPAASAAPAGEARPAAAAADRKVDARALKQAAEDARRRAADARRLEMERLRRLEAERQKRDEQDRRRAEQQERVEEEQRKAAARQQRIDAERRQKAEAEAEQKALEASKRAAERARKQKNLEEQRAEAERKKAEERRKAQQKSAKRPVQGPWPPLRSRTVW